MWSIDQSMEYWINISIVLRYILKCQDTLKISKSSWRFLLFQISIFANNLVYLPHNLVELMSHNVWIRFMDHGSYHQNTPLFYRIDLSNLVWIALWITCRLQTIIFNKHFVIWYGENPPEFTKCPIIFAIQFYANMDFSNNFTGG